MRKRAAPRFALIVLAATVGVAVGLGAALVHNDKQSSVTNLEVQPLAAQTTWASGVKRAPSFSLRDQAGRLVSLHTLRGRPVLLTFLDSVCKLECPVHGRVRRARRGGELMYPFSEPVLFASVVVAALWYARGSRRPKLHPVPRRRRSHVPAARAACFYTALAVVLVALDSPLDDLADKL